MECSKALTVYTVQSIRCIPLHTVDHMHSMRMRMNAFVMTTRAADFSTNNNNDDNHDVNTTGSHQSTSLWNLSKYFLRKLNSCKKFSSNLHCGNFAIKLSCRLCLWLSH